PYTKANHHMLNEETISLMKKGAYLINTARGGLIDTYCLYDALTNGHLAGAALDVLEEEQSLKEEAELLAKNALSSEEMKKILENHLLLQLPNVIVTPHLAFYSKEAQETILKTVVENIRAFEEGIDKNLVTLK
nr:hydroxyacid dehydrogenase [Patescibacteria group bacterium]